MKMTAVQWFALKLMCLNINNSQMHDFLEWFEESKQMEKEQILDAYLSGKWDTRDIDSNKFYEETYQQK